MLQSSFCNWNVDSVVVTKAASHLSVRRIYPQYMYNPSLYRMIKMFVQLMITIQKAGAQRFLIILYINVCTYICAPPVFVVWLQQA